VPEWAAIARNNLAGLVKAEGCRGRCRYRASQPGGDGEDRVQPAGGIGTPSAGETICGMRATESTVIMPPDIADTVAGAIRCAS